MVPGLFCCHLRLRIKAGFVMTVTEMLSQLILGPLTLILETVYGVACILMEDYGAAIIPLSLAVNFMLLPFYKRADAIQAVERAAEAKMKDGLAHIKVTFKGDERYMMQQVYYRQNHYKPIYSFRSVLPLALEVPFFIAAYQFLSDITAFDGTSFGPLQNLGAPDHLLAIGDVSINVLPIIMTVINIISSEIYTRGAPLKDKLMLHGMALLFLVLLYGSPSALVFYWTLNNVFSLAKNLIARSLNPNRVRCFAYSILGAASIAYAVCGLESVGMGQLIFFVIGVFLQIPTIQRLIAYKFGTRKSNGTEAVGDTPVFCVCSVFLALLIGLLIPMATIASSPAEFMLASNPISPLIHVVPAMLLSAGMFVLWMGLFYYLSTPRVRGAFTICIIVMAGSGIVNYLFFGTNMGTLLPLLQYEKSTVLTTADATVNFEVLLLVSTALLALWLKKRNLLKGLFIAACAAVIALSAYNAVRVWDAMPLVMKSMQHQESEDNHFVLSTKGKNVIVIMIDRAISGYLPYLFEEMPELRKQFDGFTWYPNTLSYSNSTNTASSAIYGGYDYRPEQMNERDNEPLVDKHNEALKTMPAIFSDAGYEVTVCDPPYAGYNWTPDLSIFDDCPQINKFNTEYGQFRNSEETDGNRQRIWRRNFFCFGIMKSAPILFQSFLYQGGTYFDGKLIGRESDYVQTCDGISKSRGFRDNFLDSYLALEAYPNLTETTNSDMDTFTMLYNSTAHNISLLKEPEYEPALVIDNTEYDKDHKGRFTVDGREVRVNDEDEMRSYQSNMAAMLKLGEWFDYLREVGTYDNSRIVIVADHGALMGSFSDMVFGDKYYEDAMGFNPLLMAKDFGDTGFMRDDTFMTNADTPTLAFEGLIDNPVSPFTGKPITSDAKNASNQYVFYTEEWQTTINNGNTFLPGIWLTLSSDDIFDTGSWKTVGKH